MEQPFGLWRGPTSIHEGLMRRLKLILLQRSEPLFRKLSRMVFCGCARRRFLGVRSVELAQDAQKDTYQTRSPSHRPHKTEIMARSSEKTQPET